MKPKTSRRAFLLGLSGAALLVAACGPAATPTPAPAPKPAEPAKPAAEPTKPAAEPTKPAAEPAKPAAAATTAPAATKPAATAKPAEAKPTAAAPAGAKEGATLTVWDWWNPSQAKSLGDWFDWVSQSFAQKKSGTKVEFQFVPFGTEYVQKLLAAFAAGNPPDAYHSSIIWARDFYDRGVLTELDAFLAQTPELAPDKFFGVSNFYRTTKGKTFGVPMEGPDSNVILINTKIFKEAGLDPQGENIKTWDDFAETARKLTKRDGSGSITQAGWLVQDWRGIEGFATWTYANGGQIQDQDQTKALFDGDNALQALQLQIDLLNKHKVSLPISPERQDAQQFMQGKAAMVNWGTWSPNYIKDNAPKEFEYWMIPIPKGPLGQRPAVTTWMNMVVVPKKIKNVDLSWEFAKHFSVLDTQVQRLKMLDRVAPLKGFFETQDWKTREKEAPVLSVVPKVAEMGGPYPLFRKFTESNDALGPLLQAAILGQTEPKQALNEGSKKVNEILARPAG
ncbi:MAG TPA: extracellular solute-binding protein [Chloroflexota bacterium]|nr:extracellular solute-binding protein [Chloroflexota bacterium]